VAADFENLTGDDVLHVVYRETGTTTPKLYHTYRSLSGSTPWATPVKRSTMDIYYLDIGAAGGDIYVVAGGFTTFSGGAYKPILYKWKVVPATSGYTFSALANMQSNEFHHIRVDVTKAGWNYTVWIKSAFSTYWRTEANGSITNARSISNANSTTSPAAVAVDHKGGFHLAYVRAGATSDTLVYGTWDGLSTSAVQETTIYTGKVHPASVDIAVADGLPFVTHARPTTKPETYFSRMDSTNTWHHHKIGGTGTASPYTRVSMEVDGTKTTLHGGYLDGKTLIYASCPVP
jgi:hypothetical protein